MKPIIGHQSHSDNATSFIGSPLPFNGLTYDGWVAPGFGVFEFGFNLGFTGLATASYAAFAAHNLKGSLVRILAGSQIVKTKTIQTNGPVMLRFAPAAATQWRVQVTKNDALARVNICHIGQETELERGIFMGHSPLPLNRDTEYLNNRSESGQLLGRKIIRQGATGQIRMNGVSSDYVRNTLNPLSKQLEKRGFFFQQDPIYDFETSYCWTTQDMQATNSDVGGPNNRGRMDVNFVVRALV